MFLQVILQHLMIQNGLLKLCRRRYNPTLVLFSVFDLIESACDTPD
jgi:hypothetical protein